MARTSRNGAPAASFDALDNIDIDDMFGDGNDDFLDNLADDLGLDQIGDITNNMGASNANEEGETAASAKEEKPAPTPVPAPAVEELPKRRTKRKPKSPVLLDEEEEANEAQTKRKRRQTKSGTNKKKNLKKDKDKDEFKPDTSKTKGKLKGMGLPTAIQRHSSSSGPSTPSSGNVAAAGQFGGRQKRGHMLPLSRATSDKLKTKSKSSLKSALSTASTEASSAIVSSNEKSKQKKSTPLVSTSSASEPPPPRKPAPFAPPIPQSTFCGLKPSNSLFYPFMPALPTEPSIKNRKQYPAIDRINSSFMAFINNAPNAAKGSNGGAPVPETESIHRLMHETLRDMNPAQGNAPQDDKKSAISNAIGTLRQTVSTMERPKLATDLFSACAILKRQYDFLQQNLSNMERWCKDNFSEADYASTYGSPDALKNQKESDSGSILSKFKRPLIRVKIRCSGFKEPKLSGPLYAFLPPSVVPGASAAGEHKDKKATKKRKSASSSDPSILAATGGIIGATEKEVVIKTYPELRPAKRRQLMTEHVAHTAKELEAACISRTASFCQAIDRRHNELKKMVDEDEVLVIHTAAMWQYIEKAGYFSNITEEALDDTLRSVWAPEVKHNLVREIPGKSSPSDRRRPADDRKVAARQSIFNGLQSLLVDASSDVDDVDESDDEEEGESLSHDNFDEPLLPLDSALPPGLRLSDLSGLNVDERAHMHLRGAGLLEDVPIPASNGLASNSSRGRKDGSGDRVADGPRAFGGTLEEVIERMSAHLMDLNKVNNARASFLESAARSHMSASGDGKLKAAKEAALIAKCQQLLKKSKDSRVKASKPTTATKDEYALPW